NSNGCPCSENGFDLKQPFSFEDFPKFDETQEILFPPNLITEKPASDLYLEGARVKLIAPVSWKEIDDCFRRNYDQVTIVSSGQITRLVAAQSSQPHVMWLSVHNIPTVNAVEVNDQEILVGAAVSYAELIKAINEFCDRSIGQPIRRVYNKFASLQVMNMASWAGGLITGAAEISSIFQALNIKIIVRELGGAFTVGNVSDFMSNQGRVKLGRGSIIVAATFPRSQSDLRVFVYKQGLRPGADATVVNCICAFRVTYFIEEARVAISLGSGSILSKRVSQFLRGK
ncbi:FAD binding domain in molybdopterin dehydrogenase, partial [Cooperia oncophora]